MLKVKLENGVYEVSEIRKRKDAMIDWFASDIEEL
jgi:hypothetical protein